MKKILVLLFLSFSFTAIAQAEASKLDDILATKTLRVCITSDNKPYSFLKDDGTYEGIDIAMAKSLATSLDARVKFVPTSWKNLMDDFLDDDYDIAMEGISISRARQ